MCPLESNKSIRNLYFHHRDLWEKLKKMDDEVIANGHKYRYRMFHPSDKTLREWEEYFKKEEDFKARQGSLF